MRSDQTHLMMTIYHFDPHKRPTLCAYCKAPAGPFLYKDNEYWLGACSMEHLKLIDKGEKLPNKAKLNDIGIGRGDIRRVVYEEKEYIDEEAKEKEYRKFGWELHKANHA